MGCAVVISRQRNAIRPMPRDYGAGDDEVRAEPVFLLPLVEHDLQSADGHGEQAKTDAVDAAELLAHALQVRRIFNDAAGQNDGHECPPGY